MLDGLLSALYRRSPLAWGALLTLHLTLLASASLAPAQTQWAQLMPATSPSPRSSFSIAYDVARQRAVSFGGIGTGAGYFAETWEWNGATWLQRSPSASPSGRYLPDMVFIPTLQSCLLFGGIDNAVTALNDTWLWDGTAWNQLSSSTSPPPRAGHMMAFDAARNRVVLFGGSATGAMSLNDTWLFDGASWISATVSPPPARSVAGMAYDSARQRVILFGGANPVAGPPLGDTWEWDGTQWTQRFPSQSPVARASMTLVEDPRRNRLVMHGGWNFTTSATYQDTWEWDGNNWQFRTTATGPSTRFEAGAFFDSQRRRVILFGGDFYPPWVAQNDTWEYGAVADANFVTFGTACAGTSGTPTLTCLALPWLSDAMIVRVAPIPLVALPFFVIGFSNTFSVFGPLPVDLTMLGLTNCSLNVSLDVFEPVPNLLGSAQWSLAIPNTSTLLGVQLHLQGGTSDLAANPFGAVLSGGATATIGAR